MADASFLYSKEYLRVLVHFGSVSHRLTFTVLDVSCPLVLGMPFLRDCNPVVDWKARSVSFAVAKVAAPEPANVFVSLDPEVPLAPVDSSGVAPTPLPAVACTADVACAPASVAVPPAGTAVQFSGRATVAPTTAALAACEKVGGFLPVFDTALR